MTKKDVKTISENVGFVLGLLIARYVVKSDMKPLAKTILAVAIVNRFTSNDVINEASQKVCKMDIMKDILKEDEDANKPHLVNKNKIGF